MMSKKVEELNFKDIIGKFGIPVGIEDIRAAYRYDAKGSRLKEFEQKLNTFVSNTVKGSAELLEEYSDIFDKEIYIFHISKLIELDIREEERASFLGVKRNKLVRFMDEKKAKNNKAEIVSDAKALLESSDVADLTIDKKTRRIILDLSQDYIGNTSVLTRRRNRSEKKLCQIETVIGLNKILENLYPSDIVDVCRYPNFGNVLAIDIYKTKEGKKDEERIEDKNKPKKSFFRSDFEKKIIDNIQYIDIDKLLLLYIKVKYNIMNSDEYSKSEVEDLKSSTEKVYSLLDNSSLSMYISRYKEEVHFDELQKAVEDICARLIGDKFYTDNMFSEIIDDVVSKKKLLSDYSKDLIGEVLNKHPEVLEKFVISGLKNLEFLSKNDFVSGEDIKNMDISMLPVEEVYYLYTVNKIDVQTIFDKYAEKKISSDVLLELKDVFSEKDIDKLAEEKQLVALYLKDSKSEEYNEYKKIYYILKIDGKNLEHRIKIGNKIVSQSKKLLDFNILLDLFYQDLIPLDVIAKVCNETVSAVIATVRVKPKEIRKRYEDNSLTYDMICELLRNKKINNLNKLVLIYSTFSSFADEKIRKKFLNYLSSNFTSKRLQSYEKSKVETDPANIWNTVYELDNEYEQEIIGNGTIIFRLPNIKKYIIRKIFNKYDETVYGSAIYIIDKDIFEDDRDVFVKKGELNLLALEELIEDNEAVKLINTGWEDSVKSYFITNKVEKYTKDQLNKINDLLRKVKK